MQRVRVKHEPYQALRAETGRQRAFPSLQPTLILNLGASLTVFDVCGRSISVAAGDVGYFDQPHMIRDVNEFTGLSPTALVTEMRRNNYPIQDA